MTRPIRLVVILPLLASLGWVSAYAMQLGSTDAMVYRASKEMAAWAASGNDPAPQTWQWVHDDLVQAADRSPSDPAVQELLGLMSARSGGRPEYSADAAVHFVKALESRPTSPYTWINLAEAGYRLGDTGRQFEVSLQRAAQLGPSEPEVQRTVAFYGLAVYDEVGAQTRTAIDRMIIAGFKRNPLEMLQISERRGRLGVACRLLAGIPRHTDSKWSHYCQSTEATS
jgi:predicted Zn-dependent protease